MTAVIAAGVAAIVAIVAGDKVALRAQPERDASQTGTLWKGDWLDVRGERRGWLEVYDHRRDRPGWIAKTTARVVQLDDAAAPALRAIVDFERDAPGAESLGIAYAGLYIKVAPRAAIDAGLLVELGSMADRLARRVSAGAIDATASEQLAVAQSWGIGFASAGGDGSVDDRVCYDGAAFRQALALGAGPADAAIAVLALTDVRCAPASDAGLALVDQVDPTRVAPVVGNELRLRRAELAARLAWAAARRGAGTAGLPTDVVAAAKLAGEADSALARVDARELGDDDRAVADAVRVIVAASRPALAVPDVHDGVELAIDAGRDAGETCASIAGGGGTARRCTHGQIWGGSLRIAPSGRAFVVSVAPLPGWLELWLFRRAADGGWIVDVIPPSTDGVDLGAVELVGWSADGAHVDISRRARVDGEIHVHREVLAIATLTQAGVPR